MPVPGTSLSRASNSRVPVIQAAPDAYYAVRAGIWFTAAQPTGPWSLATSVPASIYAIPPSSPIFYVTYVRIYGTTPDAVYTGYTPGYLGAVVAPTGNVVFGTGYAYPSWIGDAWYAAPPTYGVGATPVYNPRSVTRTRSRSGSRRSRGSRRARTPCRRPRCTRPTGAAIPAAEPRAPTSIACGRATCSRSRA